jgi:hypothetical protein
MIAYITIPVGVSYKAPIGVYLTEQEALAAANAYWSHSDGYHSLEVREVEIGVTYDDESERVGWLNRKQPFTDQPIQVQRRAESELKRWEV